MSTRSYDYENNLKSEYSRKRKNRKQLCFSDEEIELINDNMGKLGIDNFSLYMRAISCYGKITIEEIEELRDKLI